jgi:hypothetical protein
MAIETTTTMNSPRFSYSYDHELVDHQGVWDTLSEEVQYSIIEWTTDACEKYRRMSPIDYPEVLSHDDPCGDLIHEEFPLEYILK